MFKLIARQYEPSEDQWDCEVLLKFLEERTQQVPSQLEFSQQYSMGYSQQFSACSAKLVQNLEYSLKIQKWN